MRLPANGRDFYLDLVAQFRNHAYCTVSNSETHHEIGVAFEFKVEVRLQGSNVSEKRFQVRIKPAEADKPLHAELVTG